MTTNSILIVDDDPGQVALFKIMLRGLPHRLITAADGRMALNLLENETPTLVLLDIAMPNLNGMAVLEFVRSDPRLVATKVIIITASVTSILPPGVSRADKILSKPVLKQQLLQAVGELLALPN